MFKKGIVYLLVLSLLVPCVAVHTFAMEDENNTQSSDVMSLIDEVLSDDKNNLQEIDPLAAKRKLL